MGYRDLDDVWAEWDAAEHAANEAVLRDASELCSQCGDPLADDEWRDGLCGSCVDREAR